MAKKTPIDKLASTVDKILQDYGDGVNTDMREVVKSVAAAGVKALRAESKATFGGTGEYAKGWTSQYEEGRLSSRAILHNKKPGLPHLLEKGHAKRGGGRVAGRPHIAPVEEQVTTQLETALEAKLNDQSGSL